MTKEFEHLFLCVNVLAIHAPFVRDLSKSSAIFNEVVFLLLICKHGLYCLDTNSLSGIYVLYFFQVCGLSIHFLNGYLFIAEILRFDDMSFFQ